MSDCPICNAMMGRMCAAHADPNKCAEDMDYLDGKGVFKAILRGDVVTDGFRRDVLKDALRSSEMPEKERLEIEKHLDSLELTEQGGDSGSTASKGGPIRPLSVREAVRSSYALFRGRKVEGLD